MMKKSFNLQNCFTDEDSKESGIVRTNGLPFGSDADTGGILPIAPRINHACLQNERNTWNEAKNLIASNALLFASRFFNLPLTIVFFRGRGIDL
jgi:hypothetical protein